MTDDQVTYSVISHNNECSGRRSTLSETKGGRNVAHNGSSAPKLCQGGRPEARHQVVNGVDDEVLIIAMGVVAASSAIRWMVRSDDLARSSCSSHTGGTSSGRRCVLPVITMRGKRSRWRALPPGAFPQTYPTISGAVARPSVGSHGIASWSWLWKFQSLARPAQVPSGLVSRVLRASTNSVHRSWNPPGPAARSPRVRCGRRVGVVAHAICETVAH